VALFQSRPGRTLEQIHAPAAGGRAGAHQLLGDHGIVRRVVPQHLRGRQVRLRPAGGRLVRLERACDDGLGERESAGPSDQPGGHHPLRERARLVGVETGQRGGVAELAARSEGVDCLGELDGAGSEAREPKQHRVRHAQRRDLRHVRHVSGGVAHPLLLELSSELPQVVAISPGHLVAGVAELVISVGEAGLAQPAGGPRGRQWPQADVGHARIADEAANFGAHRLDVRGRQHECRHVVQAVAEVEQELERPEVHRVSVVDADQQR
jgi:hypothetical protein